MSDAQRRRILSETARFAALQTLASVYVWATGLLLTRWLSPHDFGVYGIGSFFLGLGALLGDGGLGAAILRQKEPPTDDEYRTAVTFLLALGAVFSVGFFAAAPVIASRYGLSPREVEVLRAMAPLYLVSAIRAVPYLRLQRELSFSHIGRVELITQLVKQTVALILAARVGGVWTLVGAQLAGASTQLTLAWVAAPGFPGLGIHPGALRRMLGYGVKVQALSLLGFFKDNLSPVVLGRVLGPSAVGLFDFGVKYAQVPVVAVNALSRVQLPIYARFDRHDPVLFDAVRGATRTALLIGLPILVAMTVGAPWVIHRVYSDRWLPAVPVVLGIAGNMAGGLIAGPLFTLLQAQGRAGLALRVFAFWTVATWGLVVATYTHGIEVVAWAYSLATLGVTALLLRWSSAHLGRSLTPHLLRPYLAAALSLALCAELSWLPNLARVLPHPLPRALAALALHLAALTLFEGSRPWRELAGAARALRGGQS
jgi:O-antigen/teichoic acid export membrane protein